MSLSSASRSRFFCGFQHIVSCETVARQPVALDDDPSQPTIALEAMPVDSTDWRVAAWFAQNDA